MYSVELLEKGPQPYGKMIERQQEAHGKIRVGDAPDTVFWLEHSPVYTLGSQTRPEHVPTSDIPVLRTGRGGSVTYHGPGQLVIYPIVRLRLPLDVAGYSRALEAAVVQTLQDEHNLLTETIPGRAGVWIRRTGEPDLKICALGLRVAHQATMHGIAINIDPDMSAFAQITPCGIADASATSLHEQGITTTPAALMKALKPRLEAQLQPFRTDEQRAKDRTGPQSRPRPENRKLLRIEARNAAIPIEDKPEWIRTSARTGPEYTAMRDLARGGGLHTVCEEAGCPNIFECWEDREATFLIGGDQCTRRCDFCMIATGKPVAYDRSEPRRVAASVRELGLRYATITGVARDDLPDGAAWLYAETCRQIRRLSPGTGVELLVDDFRDSDRAFDEIFDAGPDVFAHNLETVPRIFKQIRPAFRYDRSLQAIARATEAGLVTKSNFILGMGETTEEVIDSMHDLRDHGCDILTITQYLRPSPMHHRVDRWVKPAEFVTLREVALELGFSGVLAGPLVRSSYRAGRLWADAMRAKGRAVPEHLAHLNSSEPARQDARTLVAQAR